MLHDLKEQRRSALAAEDGIQLISERENILPLSRANEKQNKQEIKRQQVRAFVSNIRQMIWNEKANYVL